MHPQNQPTTGFPWRRIFAPLSIIATCLYLLFFVIEGIHWLHERHERTDPPAFAKSMSDTVQRQINEVRSVNTHLLANTLTTDLTTFDCNWHFGCSPRPESTVRERIIVDPDCPNCRIHFTRTETAVNPPDLVTKIGGAPIPTWHTFFGAPHALRVTAVKIAAAGPWAVITFLTCTVIYFSLALLSGSKTEKVPPLIVLIVITVAPFGITVLANLFQWAATKAFDAVSWALGLLVWVIGYSAAISLAVAVPHVLKAPREVIEATELIRHA
jgi:hypothetical protein